MIFYKNRYSVRISASAKPSAKFHCRSAAKPLFGGQISAVGWFAKMHSSS
jgi:hypothetical protein